MRELFNSYRMFLDVTRGLEADRRTMDQEAFAHAARVRAAMIEAQYLEEDASGALGNARLGDLNDAEAAGLLDSAGWYLGHLKGRFLYHNADGHNLIYGRSGSGKGVTSAQPNLAHSRDSLFVIDVKDGELHYSSAAHRALTLGHKVITLDPWGVRGGGAKASPLHGLARIAQSGKAIDAEADEIALIMMPMGQADAGSNSWVRSGARELISLRLKDLAYRTPERLTLSELWRFMNAPSAEIEATLREMANSDREEIRGIASAKLSIFLNAPKQWEGYASEISTAVSPYAPGSALARATEANDVDFAEMKTTPTTVYLCVPSKKLGVAARWLALMLNHAIEEIAAAGGRLKVRFLCDEIANLPPVPAIMKTLRTYRARGVHLSIYCQGRFSLRDAGYAESAVKELEDQAACLQMWGVEDPSLIKDIELWSGRTSVVQVRPAHSGGAVAQGSLSRDERARPLLQAEDIRRIGDGQQIIKVPGHPLFVAERPPYWKISPWKSQLRDVREYHRQNA